MKLWGMDWLQNFDTGATLVVNSSWKNPSGEWHVGYKLVYELFTESLTSRLKVSNDLDYIDWLKSLTGFSITKFSVFAL